MAKLADAFGCGVGVDKEDNPNTSRILAVKLSHTNEKQHLITIGSRARAGRLAWLTHPGGRTRSHARELYLGLRHGRVPAGGEHPLHQRLLPQ
jgi:hypothetical protein